MASVLACREPFALQRRVANTFLVVFLLFAGPASYAGVSEKEANRLGKDLTPFGAIKAGNDDGSIPAWTGGLSEKPKGYRRSGQHHVDPFSSDKPLYTVTSANMKKYSAILTPGLEAIFKTYPATFKVPVYKSRRTHTTPDWVIKNTRENAVNAKLVANGNGIENAYGGVPFPILHGRNEEKALQAIWNHITRWRGVFLTRRSSEAVVERNGAYSLVNSQQEAFWNFFHPESNPKKLKNILVYYMSFTKSPARLAGGAILVHETINQVKEPRRAWGYNKGTRRVRRAPNLAHDSPVAAAGNLRTTDDTDMFNGAPDLYDWKYVGLKEMLIPYNNYLLGSNKLKYKDILTVSHMEPKYTRWEKHRVHIIEANLKKSARHIYKKRVFYIDEDSWNIALVDQYDRRGNLWRVSMAFLKNYYELPGVWTVVDAFIDLQAQRYHVQGLENEEKSARVFENKIPGRRYFRPRELRRRGR